MMKEAMRILVVEDDPISRRLLQKVLENWDYEVLAVEDGLRAWKVLEEQGCRFVIADWMMPGLDGVALCRKLRESDLGGYVYFIILTAKGQKEDVVEGLKAGADDFVIKPFEREELKVRVKAGERILNLEARLKKKVSELEEALSRIQQLEGILPICAFCKKIRDDEGTERGKGTWHTMESYISQHSAARFSHTYCPECMKKHFRIE
jgi:DNA-binding response OmpR family regulator